MHRMLKLLTISWLLFTHCVCSALELELTRGVDNALSIAIFSFVGEKNISDDFNNITPTISNDLKNSGRFRLVDSNQLAAISPSSFVEWRAKKVEAIVTGQITSTSGGQLLVLFSLLDVYNGKKLFEKEYPVKKEQLRRLAHHISDIVYQKLTGVRGVFSTKIAYILVERQGKVRRHKLEVADSDGANRHTLLVSRFPLMSPAWSPDEKKIAYVSFEGHRAAIYAQDVATGKREILIKLPGINGAPAWSPDGNKLALVLTLTGYPKIYVLNLSDKKLERLTDGWYLDTEPNWAPDGQSIIFTSNRGGSPQIYRIYLGNNKIERVTFSGSYNARASFTPSGNGIVMLHQEGEMFSIAYEDLKSHRLMLLTSSGLNESPSIAPNGKMVVYATNSNGRGMLAEVSIDGRVRLLLPAGDGVVQEPAWSPY